MVEFAGHVRRAGRIPPSILTQRAKDQAMQGLEPVGTREDRSPPTGCSGSPAGPLVGTKSLKALELRERVLGRLSTTAGRKRAVQVLEES